MANLSRSDRQLMRQRGAGMRNVNNVDFGLNIASQETREDRQLMRQRGAGTRNVSNVDFGFAFPTPTQSRRSSRTPGTARSNTRLSSKALVSQPQELLSAVTPGPVSSTQTQRISSNVQQLSKTPQPNSRILRPGSSKRRRLDHSIDLAPSGNGVVDLQPIPQQSLKSPTFTIVEEEERTGDNTVSNSMPGTSVIRTSNYRLRSASPLFVSENEDKENERVKPYKANSTSKQGKHDTIVDNAGLGDQPQLDARPDEYVAQSIEATGHEGIVDEDDDSNRIQGSGSESHLDSDRSPPLIVQSSTSIRGPASSDAKPTKKRKKRKSVVLGSRKKRRSSESAGKSVPQIDQNSINRSDVITIDRNSEEATNTEPTVTTSNLIFQEATEPKLPLWKKLAFKRAQRKRTRLSVSTSPVRHRDEDEEADETYIDEDGSPEPITPAPKKKVLTAKTGKEGAGGSDKPKQQKGVKQNSFPIVAYRMTNTHALPTIVEEDNNDNASDVDQNGLSAVFADRPQPNAVDVLAQICRETIESTIEKLGATPSGNSSRAEIKRKRSALEAFGENLELRLFEMSEAVEHRLNLEARLRKCKREKAELQARWIEIRQQRDEIALKTDAVRRQNWDNEEQAKRQWEISELAHRTELEVERDSSHNDDIEFTIKQVAANVSSSSVCGGILNKVKAFNSQLERLAHKLEAR